MMDIEKKLATLAEKRRRIMALPAKEAMELIVSSPEAPAIVHSMAEQDFYFLINEIGAEDSLELLALASSKQWEYILDVVSWHKDQIDGKSVVNWFELLMAADADRFVRWMSRDKADFLELFFYYTIEVGLRIHDQEPSEFADDFFTFDDLFYIRFIEKEKAYPDFDESALEHRDRLLYRFLKQLAETDYEQYREFLYYSANVLPAEAEEEAYRLRNVRLAEKGLLPFDEAIGIYQPLTDISRLPQKNRAVPLMDSQTPVPLAQAMLLEKETVFSRALARIDSAAVLRDLQTELAALGNRLAVADQMPVRGVADLSRVMAKASGYINIGFSRISGHREIDPERAAHLLHTYYLADIFRIGYSEAAAVKQEADRWYQASWVRRRNLPLHFWDDRRQGVLAGLLIKRPLFYDKQQGIFREFSSMAEIEQARSVLAELTALDNLLALADYDPAAVSKNTLTVENLLLTAWTRNWLDKPDLINFISIADFQPFFEHLFGKRTAAGDCAGSGRRIGDDMKQSFLHWLAGKTGLSAFEISQQAGFLLEEMFAGLEAELGRVASEDLDPAYIHLFLVC